MENLERNTLFRKNRNKLLMPNLLSYQTSTFQTSMNTVYPNPIRNTKINGINLLDKTLTPGRTGTAVFGPRLIVRPPSLARKRRLSPRIPGAPPVQ